MAEVFAVVDSLHTAAGIAKLLYIPKSIAEHDLKGATFLLELAMQRCISLYCRSVCRSHTQLTACEGQDEYGCNTNQSQVKLEQLHGCFADGG